MNVKFMLCVIVMFNFYKWLRDIWLWWIYKNEYMNFEIWFFFLVIKWICMWKFLFYKICIFNRKIIKWCKNVIERVNCMLLFEKIEIKLYVVI